MILISKSELLDHLKYMSEIKTDQLKEVIDHLPIVEVVRCKDCKWYSNHHLCIQMSRFGSIEPLADFFCAFGERSEE